MSDPSLEPVEPTLPGGNRLPARPLSQAGSAREIAKRLGRKLTPVVLDLGPGQPRFASYLEWDERSKTAVLSPIAGPALELAGTATEKIRMRSSDPAEPWMITLRGLRLQDSRKDVLDLEGGAVARMRDRIPNRAPVGGQEPLVLAVHAGPASIEGHVFPVLGLGAGHCLIDATLPLEHGEVLGPIEIVGEQRIIRRASARVIEVIPWITAHGDRRFRCRLTLEERATIAVRDEGHDLFSDPDRLGRLFDLASMLNLPGWYDAPGWPRARMRIHEVSERLVTLNVDALPPPDVIPLPDEIRVGFELFSVSYEGRARLHRRRGGKLEIALPLVMRRGRRRREQRAQVPESLRLTVVFRNAATGDVARRRVKDVSFGGLCFKIDPARDVLWKDAFLEDARLEWQGKRVGLGDLEVRDIGQTDTGEGLCHVANRRAARSHNPALIDLLASLCHPEVERHDGADFRVMVDFYKRAGLLGDFMLRNLRPVLPAATRTWNRLHDKESNVACTLLFRGAASEPSAAFSGVQVWEKTWLAQHFGALSTADRRATGTLQIAYVDFVTPQKDAHYMAFFVRADNARMNAFYEKFFDLTGTAESVSRITVGLWMLPSSDAEVAPVAAGGHGIRRMKASDEMIASRAAERVFGPMASSALSLVPKGFDLPDTRRRFARLDLERTRDAFMVSHGRRPSLALLKERTSPGVNLTWMLDAWWLLPVGPIDDGAVSVAAAEIARSPANRPSEDKFLIVPDGFPPAALKDAGFAPLLNAHLYVLNRSGLRRYYEYISDRYGELGARVSRHEARAARSAS